MAQGSSNTSIPFANTTTRRYDGSDANTQYAGYAPSGVNESDNAWTITRIVINSDGSVTTTSATNVAWSNRLSVIYS
jgi:hypothetical protein